MCARGDAASHAIDNGFLWDWPSENSNAPSSTPAGFFAIFVHIALTWLESKPLHCCLMPNHVLCLVHMQSLDN